MPCSSSPQKGLLAEDLDAELDRLYRDQVEPPRYGRRFEELSTRSAIRTRANQVFRSRASGRAWSAACASRSSPIAGDPMRIDYAYRRNGTRGFVQALPLGRDPGQAKVLAFTADAIRAKLAKTEFLAVIGGRAAAAGKCAAPVCDRAARGARNSRRAAGAPGGMGAAHAASAARSQRPLTGTLRE